MKRDIADEETEKVLKEIENQISKEYAQAEKEIAKKLDDYLKKFEAKDELKRKAVANGIISEKEYKEWRIGQIMIGQRWTEMRNTLAQDLTNADKIARSITFEHMPYVYAINHDYSTFLIEKASLLETSYTLYDRHAMEQLVKDADTFIPAPGRKVSRDIKEGKALEWNNKLVQSAMMQSLLQGEAIPDIATRLAKTVGDSDRKAAIRNARTLTTGIENAGRIASYKQANEMGIETRKQWLATLDDRTRHWHASLDGETVDYDQPFENELGEIMFPGDPAADPGNIFNCRCTLIPSIKGFERDVSDMNLRHDDHLGDMTYDEWKAGKYEQTSDPITKQDTVSEIMTEKYIEQYKDIESKIYDLRKQEEEITGMTHEEFQKFLAKNKSSVDDEFEGFEEEKEKYNHIQEQIDSLEKQKNAIPDEIIKNIENGNKDGIIKESSIENETYKLYKNVLDKKQVEYNEVTTLEKPLTEEEIIMKVAGGDETDGSCVSQALAYVGNKAGYDVNDYRGGESQDFFASRFVTSGLPLLPGIKGEAIKVKKELSGGIKALEKIQEGKEYMFSVGKHTAIVRRISGKLEYLELQSNEEVGWKSFGDIGETLYKRFKARKESVKFRNSNTVFETDIVIIETNSFEKCPYFKDLLGYLNTSQKNMKRGALGGVK